MLFQNVEKPGIGMLIQDNGKIRKGREGMLKHGILGLLNYHAMTGYEIMQVFRDSLNYFWSVRTSQIYRELQGMEDKKWVGKEVVAQIGKPDKKVYFITEEGKKELLLWLAAGDVGLSPRTPILMKVFFMGERKREDNIAYFVKLKGQCQDFLEKLQTIPEYIEAYGKYIEGQEKTLYWQMTVDFGVKNMQMYIDWAQSCIEKLEGTK